MLHTQACSYSKHRPAGPLFKDIVYFGPDSSQAIFATAQDNVFPGNDHVAAVEDCKLQDKVLFTAPLRNLLHPWVESHQQFAKMVAALPEKKQFSVTRLQMSGGIAVRKRAAPQASGSRKRSRVEM